MCKGVEWIYQAEDMVQLMAVLSMLIKCQVSYTGKNFLFQVCDRLFLKKVLYSKQVVTSELSWSVN
jgi:hypothetical protein